MLKYCYIFLLKEGSEYKIQFSSTILYPFLLRAFKLGNMSLRESQHTEEGRINPFLYSGVFCFWLSFRNWSKPVKSLFEGESSRSPVIALLSLKFLFKSLFQALGSYSTVFAPEKKKLKSVTLFMW